MLPGHLRPRSCAALPLATGVAEHSEHGGAVQRIHNDWTTSSLSPKPHRRHHLPSRAPVRHRHDIKYLDRPQMRSQWGRGTQWRSYAAAAYVAVYVERPRRVLTLFKEMDGHLNGAQTNLKNSTILALTTRRVTRQAYSNRRETLREHIWTDYSKSIGTGESTLRTAHRETWTSTEADTNVAE